MTETKDPQAGTSAGDLEQATERMNEVIARAEEVFAERFAVRGEVPMSDSRKLSFSRKDGVGRFTVTGAITGKPIFLSAANRQIRTEALNLLPVLLLELEQVNGNALAEITAAVFNAEQFLSKVSSSSRTTRGTWPR